MRIEGHYAGMNWFRQLLLFAQMKLAHFGPFLLMIMIAMMMMMMMMIGILGKMKRNTCADASRMIVRILKQLHYWRLHRYKIVHCVNKINFDIIIFTYTQCPQSKYCIHVYFEGINKYYDQPEIQLFWRKDNDDGGPCEMIHTEH